MKNIGKVISIAPDTNDAAMPIIRKIGICKISEFEQPKRQYCPRL
ncbi:MAG: hypothetical protein ACJA2N_000837 [Salibacteraceae bacterium]|jgi:hypothetical protein